MFVNSTDSSVLTDVKLKENGINGWETRTIVGLQVELIE